MIQHASIDDSTLFERITRHDAEAFGIVMRRYAGALYAFAFRIVGDTLAAEDIVQEVFINLWEKRRKLSPGPSLRNFLYLAVRNLSLNHLRMQKNHLAQTNAYLFEQKAGLWVIEEERYRLLSEAINSIIDAKEESDIDSLFKRGGTTALLSAVSGLDDFELICFLVVK